MTKRRRHSEMPGPRPTIPESRSVLLAAVLEFVRRARDLKGVRRFALIGSLANPKPIPKDANVLVTIDPSLELNALARHARASKGAASHINFGADIFLADTSETYVGRTCSFRECHPRRACSGRSCYSGMHLNDDLHILTLAQDTIDAPAVELWPQIVRRRSLPIDVEELLLAPLLALGGEHQIDRSMI